MAAIFIFLLVQMFCALKVKQAHTKKYTYFAVDLSWKY